MPDDMFLELENVAGESKDQKFSGKIDIYGFSWGVSNIGSGGYGGGSGVGQGECQRCLDHEEGR